jgi:hypothetical protein
MIFRWVKFEGYSQSWVGQQFEMHQSTVSRIVQRYEKWIAHGGPQSEGSLTHDERLRTQHWMTYERNEWILSSALRIAGQMEQALDTSKSVISHAAAHPSRETLVRTESRLIDRSGIAARFLRLAHRVNMDQLALVAQPPLPSLEPLSEDEMAIEETPIARSPRREPLDELPEELSEELPVQLSEEPDAMRDDALDDRRDDARESAVPCESGDRPGESQPPGTPDPWEAPSEPDPLEAMHGVHNPSARKTHLTAEEPATYSENEPPKKPLAAAYPVASQPPGIAEIAYCPAGA